MRPENSTIQTSVLPQVEEFLKSVGDLPASPNAIKLVMDATANFDTDIQQLARALSADQSIAAKALKLSNSSFYGRTQSVATLEEAIVVLGFFTLRSLVVATATHNLFQNENTRGYQQKLWEHSLASAIAARIIAKRIGYPKVEEAFLAGLMHDLGQLIFLQKTPSEYLLVISEAESSHEALFKHESERYGFDHTELGQALMMHWSFPPELVEAVRDHHNAELKFSNPKSAPLSAITFVANSLVNIAGITILEGQQVSSKFQATMEKLELDIAELDEVVSNIREVFEAEVQLFRE